MKERPILFSTPMVKAILEGRKTQTRRVMKPQPEKIGGFWCFAGAGWSRDDISLVLPSHSMANRCPYGQPGDRLWVRETWAEWDAGLEYRADMTPAAEEQRKLYHVLWRPSIFMRREYSRITLEIVNVRVERVRQITNDDAMAEGVRPIGWLGNSQLDDFRTSFGKLWDSINEKRGYGWNANPWVWVVEFRRVK